MIVKTMPMKHLSSLLLLSAAALQVGCAPASESSAQKDLSASAKMTSATGTESPKNIIVFIGDGSYMMMNSDIYSSVLSQKKLIILVLDNGGFAVINKLQNNTGNESFNNLIADCPTVPEPFAVDFESHARSQGALAETVSNPAELAEAFKRAKEADRTSVICMQVDAYEGWTGEGHTWWECGTPQVSQSADVRAAHDDWESSRPRQRKGV